MDIIETKMKMINVSMRIDEHDYDVITEYAKKDARSLNGQLRYIIGKYIEQNGGRSAVFGDVSKVSSHLEPIKDNWSEGF